MPVLPDRLFGPDWMVHGDSLAHDTRWAAVRNRVMSKPTSAIMTWVGDVHADTCDLIQAGDRGQCHGGRVAAVVDFAGAAIDLGGGRCGDLGRSAHRCGR